MPGWSLVLLGGAVGAPVRYLIGVAAKAHARSTFHWGTFLANMAAALLLGFLVQGGTEGRIGATEQALLATGFCGALSTWSTFSHEILAMTTARTAAAAGYLFVTLAVGMGLSFAGGGIARALW